MVHEWHSSQSFELLDPEAVPPPAPWFPLVSLGLLFLVCRTVQLFPNMGSGVVSVDFLLASSA